MFKFRLQRLLELRERAEQEKAVALVEADAVVDAARAALANLEAVRTIGRDRLHEAHGAAGTVGELRNLVFVLEQLDAQVAGASASVCEAERQREVVHQDLSAAHRDRRVLDRLRDRHHADWRDLEAQADRQQMDDIALSRFTQAAQPPRRTA